MSHRAEQQRTRRQHEAAPGSRHDYVVKFLQFVLPSAIGVLAAFLALAPFIRGGEVSFLLAKDQVAIAHEHMRVSEAQYRGEDAEQRPFSLKAGSAVQKSANVPLVELKDLSARIQLDSGPAVLEADRGEYDLDTEKVEIDGPVQYRSADGYRLSTRDVEVDIRGRKMQSNTPVTGRVPAGTFSANRLRADLEARTVTLEGGARLRMTQDGFRLPN